jgi:hypothetical protein
VSMDHRYLPSFSLILQEWEERFPFEVLLPLIERYFERAGTQPQIGTVEGEAPAEIKTYSFRTIRKRIQDHAIHGLHTLDAYHLTDKENKQSHDFAIGFSNSFHHQHAYILNAVSPAPEAKAMALDFLRDALNFVSPCYGYSLELPLGNDPILFSQGMFARTDHADVEATAWQFASRRDIKGKGGQHMQGRFRHVFAINVLSAPHMANRVDGRSFADWVKAPGHGSIEQWKDNVWVWLVPKEVRIRVANILQFNGLLTAPSGFENELIG